LESPSATGKKMNERSGWVGDFGWLCGEVRASVIQGPQENKVLS
jgi:hypothetical protein